MDKDKLLAEALRLISEENQRHEETILGYCQIYCQQLDALDSDPQPVKIPTEDFKRMVAEGHL